MPWIDLIIIKFKTMKSQNFYLENKDFLLQNLWPETEVLIECAEQQLNIEKNEKELHRTSLFFLIDSFRDFVKRKNPQSFWIFEEPNDGLFPFEDLKPQAIPYCHKVK